MQMDFRGRQKNLREELERRKVDALVVTHLPNVRYLCGFTGSAGVLLAAGRSVFFTDGRYKAQAAGQVEGVRISITKGGALAAAAEACVKLGLRRVAIESEHLTVAQLGAFEQALGKGVKVVRLAGAVEELRALKDADEIELLRHAVKVSSRLFRPLLRSIARRRCRIRNCREARVHVQESRRGAECHLKRLSPPAHARRLPHGVASAAKLPSAGFVVLDYGIVLDGYCSDMTRTVHIAKASAEARALYVAVLEAQLAAISAVRPGATTGEVDQAARQELKRAKLDRFFTHSTGHGVGLEIHEPPRLAAGTDAVLRPGMVITIEPGVYLPGNCGVRIEDMVLVTEHGYEVLTPVSKELIELN